MDNYKKYELFTTKKKKEEKNKRRKEVEENSTISKLVKIVLT